MIKRFIPAFTVFLLILIGLIMPSVARTAAPAGPPNIVLIVTDDQRADTVPHMPELQKIAGRGTTFINAYTPNPLCCPTRTALLTGRYPHVNGVMRNSPPNGG